MPKKFRWIADDIDISSFYDKLSEDVKELILEAEAADLSDSMGGYYTACDNIEVYSKLLVPKVITVEEWELLCKKYYPV